MPSSLRGVTSHKPLPSSERERALPFLHVCLPKYWASKTQILAMQVKVNKEVNLREISMKIDICLKSTDFNHLNQNGTTF
eukprot:2846428-Karenia_brevis.AAC.1